MSDDTKKSSYISDIETLRKRAREHIEQGAVTPSYHEDRERVIDLLNQALATELVCILRYKHHYFTAEGLTAPSVSEEFLEHANDEQIHADWLAARIRQLGGNPNFNPEGILTRSHSEYQEGENLVDMIREDLIAERIAVESYREIIRFLGEGDPTSRRLMEKILEKEEEHADDMSSLLERLHRELGQDQQASAARPKIA